MPFSELTDEQQAAFRARLALAGIDPDGVVKHVGPDTHSGQLTASADPARSTIPPHTLTVHDVDTLKQLHGNPDEHYESGLMEEHHAIPSPWPQELAGLTRETATGRQRRQVHDAHRVWLYGNSANVQSYKDAINALEYPRQIPVFAAEDLVITAENSPYVIEASESGHIYGTVTIYNGGSIAFQGSVDFSCQQLVQSDASGPTGGDA